MKTIDYDDITQLVTDVKAASENEVLVKMPEGALSFHAKFIAISLVEHMGDAVKDVKTWNEGDRVGFIVNK